MEEKEFLVKRYVTVETIIEQKYIVPADTPEEAIEKLEQQGFIWVEGEGIEVVKDEEQEITILDTEYRDPVIYVEEINRKE